MGRKTHGDLFRGVSCFRKPRQPVFLEVADFRRFDVGREPTAGAAAQYEELEHPVRIGQRVVIGAVLHRDESLAPHIEPSLLLDLLDGVGPNGLVLVDPASGQ